jgi:glycerol kinase
MCWNKSSGVPYANAIVWSDMRTCSICDHLSQGHSRDRYRLKTGLPISTYFSAPKLMYLLETVPNLREDAAVGDAVFGTINSWLLYKLTGNLVHATDVTNASRTLMMNIQTLQWDDEILSELNIPRSMLPPIYSSSYIFGHVSGEHHFELSSLQGIPICSMIGSYGCEQFEVYKLTDLIPFLLHLMPRRSASCIIWASLFRGRRGEMYLRNRSILVNEHWGNCN